MPQLSINDHNRDSAGLTYVYPVISRRSGGLSIGINLNPNNACNWRCVYCQVPKLKRGGAPQINLVQLKLELNNLLNNICYGDFYDHYSLPIEQRKICDIAISGNGEPTTCREFESVIEIIGQIYNQFALTKLANLILITNGSLMSRLEIQRGLNNWAQLGGEVWFKIDRATEEGMSMVNNAKLSPQKVLHHLKICSELCPTWIQTCLFALDGNPPSEQEQLAYLTLLEKISYENFPIKGVLLYGLARPSLQKEALRLSKLPQNWLTQMANKIKNNNFEVSVNE